MPSNQSPLGALPARFRRQRVLIVGCGDVGLRVARALPAGVRVMALTSSAARVQPLRDAGVLPLRGNLDQPRDLRRLAGLAHRVVHLAPPPREGWRDTRTRALAQALGARSAPIALVYGSTSGVYGDCGGAWIDEVQRLGADTPRAHRRVDAEGVLRFFGRSHGVSVSTLRIPGIYAGDRAGGTPRERLLRGTAVLCQEEDVFTNHIHADDLARACVRALWKGCPQRSYNVSDDTELRMGDYFDLAADLYGLPRPPRVSRQQARAELPLMLWSFMNESRRLRNRRMKLELGLRLRYPTVAEGLQAV